MMSFSSRFLAEEDGLNATLVPFNNTLTSAPELDRNGLNNYVIGTQVATQSLVTSR